jgi:hypothetical protein
MNIGEVILNFILITLLGLLIAFNPSLIVLNFFLVLKSKTPVRDTLMLTAGVLIPLIIVSLIFVFWLKPDSSFDIGGLFSNIKIPPLIDLIFGLSLITYASLRYSRRRLHAAHQSAISNKAKQLIASPSSIFSFGLIRSSLSITNLLAVAVICKTIVLSDARPIVGVLFLVYGLAIGMMPLLAPTYLYKYTPRSLERFRNLIDNMLARDISMLVTIILAIVGLGFLIHGAAQVNGGS